MNRIDEDVKTGQFSRFYLLYGEENYLKEYYRNKLRRALIREDDTINLNVFREDAVDVNELVSQALTLPFFAEHRLIIAEDTGLFKKGGGELAEVLDTIPDETVLVFVESEADARGKLFMAFQKNGVVLKLERQKEDYLARWIGGWLKKEGLQIENAACALFLERTGDDMCTIATELEKLASFVHGRSAVTVEDVRQITTVQTEQQVYELTGYICAGKKEEALDLYYTLISQRESGLRILGYLTRQFMQIHQAKDLREQGLDVQTISDKMQMRSSYFTKKLLALGSRFSLDTLEQILNQCAKVNADIKTGMMGEVLAVELLITRLCS